ncbi:HET-domain-containing protein [Lepidopterella palustris CBS 459.81]|uniref:HET-domain-containing protein n=1 Tax=Lepidopterella palustris CBS 459.81 TaxID=1314670 RepID=A0A8E2E6I2_9PEZI|nr:HET-domain-containing protein [Lepidopterella palustris CBS 459.81]
MGSISYSPLNQARQEIRLICLHPGQWTDPISINLTISSLHSAKLPFFEAVSYTWGDPSAVIPVIISEITVSITRSVENVLRRFRFANSVRLLWIDALCINQNDIAERAVQVKLMDRIYSRASRVLIYLGEADHRSDRAMDAIAERKTSTGSIQNLVLEFFETRQWFQRVWVLQEVALATYALAICGSKCVPWANFPAWWAQNAASLQDKSPPSALAYNPVTNKSFLEQLHDTRASRATDPRDKVFALAAMSPPEDRLFIEPNYMKPVASIYIDVAFKMVHHYKSLRILSATQPLYGQVCPEFSGKLPSWVPNWSKESALTSLGLSNIYREPFDAGGSTAFTRSEEDNNKLLCYGALLDIITETGKACPFETSGGESVAQVLTEWNRLASSVNGTHSQTSSRLGQGVFFVGEQFFIVGPAQETIWPTFRAVPTPTLELTPEELAKREAGPATMEDLKFCLGRRFLMTAGGLFGLAPPQALPGDIIVILLGAPVPQVLRKHDGYYELVGECYVHGVMGGEALADLKKDITQIVPEHRVRPFYKDISGNSGLTLDWFELR